MAKTFMSGGVGVVASVLIVCSLIAICGSIALILVVWRQSRKPKEQATEKSQLLKPSNEPCKDGITNSCEPPEGTSPELNNPECNTELLDDQPFHSSLWGRCQRKSLDEFDHSLAVDASTASDPNKKDIRKHQSSSSEEAKLLTDMMKLDAKPSSEHIPNELAQQRSSLKDANGAKVLAEMIKPERKSSLDRIHNELALQRPSLKVIGHRRRSSQLSDEKMEK